MFDLFYIRCTKNNTLVSIDSRGQRDATIDLHNAKRFGLESSALDFMDEVAKKEGYFFKGDHEVVKGSNYNPDALDLAAWPHVDLKQFKLLADKLGISNLERFRGKLGHLTALMHFGKFEEMNLIIKELEADEEARHYPETSQRYSVVETTA